MTNLYVVYCHLYADTGEIFYYGAGWQSRPYDLYNRTEKHREIARQRGVRISILHENLTKKEAHRIERELISSAFSNNEKILNFSPEKRKEIGRLTGLKTFKTKTGVHGRTPEQMSKDGKKAGTISYYAENGLGKSDLSRAGKKGGKIGGVIGGALTGQQQWQCGECG